MSQRKTKKLPCGCFEHKTGRKREIIFNPECNVHRTEIKISKLLQESRKRNFHTIFTTQMRVD